MAVGTHRVIYYEGDTPDLSISSDGWLSFFDDDRKWQPLVDLTLHADLINQVTARTPEGIADTSVKSIILAIIHHHCICGEMYVAPNPHLLERRGVSHYVPTDILLPHDLTNKIMTDELPREIIHIHKDISSCQKCFEEFDEKQLDFFATKSATPSHLGMEERVNAEEKRANGKSSTVSLKDFF